MNLEEFRNQSIRQKSGIGEKFGKIFVFIDFANVNNWFAEDIHDWEMRKISRRKLLV